MEWAIIALFYLEEPCNPKTIDKNNIPKNNKNKRINYLRALPINQ